MHAIFEKNKPKNMTEWKIDNPDFKFSELRFDADDEQWMWSLDDEWSTYVLYLFVHYDS